MYEHVYSPDNLQIAGLPSSWDPAAAATESRPACPASQMLPECFPNASQAALKRISNAYASQVYPKCTPKEFSDVMHYDDMV